MGIVAYVPPSKPEMQMAVQDAVGVETVQVNGQPMERPRKVVFRDPALFQPCDADPLETVVYAGANDYAIRAAYAAFPQTVVLDVDAGPVPEVPRLVAGRRSRRPSVLSVGPTGDQESEPAPPGGTPGLDV